MQLISERKKWRLFINNIFLYGMRSLHQKVKQFTSNAPTTNAPTNTNLYPTQKLQEN